MCGDTEIDAATNRRRYRGSSAMKVAKILFSFISLVAAAWAFSVAHAYQGRQTTGTGWVAARGPANGVVLLIRHAEKPMIGRGLAPSGKRRAEAYIHYFEDFRLGADLVKIQELVAAADSIDSQRARLTLTPLSLALGLPVQQPCADQDVQKLASWLAAQPADRTILVAWHHEKLPKLLAALGADPAALLPHGTWPEGVYNWVIVLRFDVLGHLSSAQRIVEPALGIL